MSPDTCPHYLLNYEVSLKGLACAKAPDYINWILYCNSKSGCPPTKPLGEKPKNSSNLSQKPMSSEFSPNSPNERDYYIIITSKRCVLCCAGQEGSWRTLFKCSCGSWTGSFVLRTSLWVFHNHSLSFPLSPQYLHLLPYSVFAKVLITGTENKVVN